GRLHPGGDAPRPVPLRRPLRERDPARSRTTRRGRMTVVGRASGWLAIVGLLRPYRGGLVALFTLVAFAALGEAGGLVLLSALLSARVGTNATGTMAHWLRPLHESRLHS